VGSRDLERPLIGRRDGAGRHHLIIGLGLPPIRCGRANEAQRMKIHEAQHSEAGDPGLYGHVS
jgi:hypothetical protein